MTEGASRKGLWILVILVVFTVSCATMDEIQVALSSTRLEAQGCKFIESKQIFDPIGPKSLISAIKDEVRRVGGNTVTMTSGSGFMTEYAFVEIWACPAIPTVVSPTPTPVK